jgi:hypothetical protein
MSKFKVGDKVVRVSRLPQFIDAGGSSGVFTVRSENAYTLTLNEIECQYFRPSFFELAQDEWTIYNNDKPLSELSDEQAAELFNHKRRGGSLEINSDQGWFGIKRPQWDLIGVYRAKQKSERELFEEALINAIGDDALSIADDLFDAGFKAPKGGE